MKLTFIVAGTETIVTARKTDMLEIAAQKALNQSGNTRHLSEWQIICNDTFLPSDQPIHKIKCDNPITESDVIFLSLKAGMGGDINDSPLGLIAIERIKQISKLGFDDEHDEGHPEGELARAAAAYALPAEFRLLSDFNTMIPDLWPSELGDDWWKPSPDNRIKELVKAGAFITAEIRRLQLIEKKGGQ